MESPNSVLVIYRLKFKSKPGFDKAIEVFRFGEKLRMYIESLQRSFSLKGFEPNYPAITPPEVNLCKDDLVIYLCSYEDRRYFKGYSGRDVFPKGTIENLPKLPFYYELFLKTTFGPVADLTVAVGDPS